VVSRRSGSSVAKPEQRRSQHAATGPSEVLSQAGAGGAELWGPPCPAPSPPGCWASRPLCLLCAARSRGGSRFWAPSVVFQEGSAMWLVLRRRWSASHPSPARKKPTSCRKRFLNGPAVQPKGYPRPAPGVYSSYCQPRELTAVRGDRPGLSDAAVVGGVLAGRPRSRPAPCEETFPKPRRRCRPNHPARAGCPGNEGKPSRLRQTGTDFQGC